MTIGRGVEILENILLHDHISYHKVFATLMCSMCLNHCAYAKPNPNVLDPN